MFNREILNNLEIWKNKADRKPLVLRGARQVGKTTVVNLFAKSFDRYIYLNLEKNADRKLFEQKIELHTLIQAIHFHKNLSMSPSKTTLIFIDEIQNSPEAIQLLRYFYEDFPEYYIIAAGSLLEPLIDTHISFPVGRVTYEFMKPMTFKEYLNAIDEKQAIEMLNTIPCPTFVHEKLLALFHQYVLIGGFPEAVKSYAESNDLIQVQKIYDDLMLGYSEDVIKYAPNEMMAKYIRHAIQHAPLCTGERIKFHGFGQSNHGSKEMGEALRTLEKAMLLKLIYPTTCTELPLSINHKKSPRLQFIDTGLINYAAKLQQHYFSLSDLSSLHQGKIAGHIVGQELFANSTLMQQSDLTFWVREKSQSNAEIDYVLSYQGKVIPIEVKAGTTGRLRSLHQFINRGDKDFAVRFYAGEHHIDKVTTPEGKPFTLLNLPFYLAGSLHLYL